MADINFIQMFIFSSFFGQNPYSFFAAITELRNSSLNSIHQNIRNPFKDCVLNETFKHILLLNSIQNSLYFKRTL